MRIAIGLVAVILYVAAYFDCVGTDVQLQVERGANGAGVRMSRVASYKFARSFFKYFFYPMHLIDRSLVRPEFWDPQGVAPPKPLR